MQVNAPTRDPDPDPAAPGEHAVRFYEKDQQLLDEVGEFLDDALRAGGLALVIATAGHRSELARRLSGMGRLGASDAGWYSGRLVMLDAAETLQKFMVGRQPDRARFEAALTPLLEDSDTSKPLHAFGEMVALLCEDGNYEGALALETLWNGLVRRRRFHLFCGYPWRLFSSSEHARAFRHVCEAHGRVLEGRDGAGAVRDPARTLAQLQHQTRVLQAEVQRRREAEQTLRQRERELADFLDNASEGIHKVAADGTILYANRAELDMLGYAWEEYVGHHIGDFYVEPRQVEAILERLGRGEVLRDEPALLRCRDGSVKPVLICSNGYYENQRLVYTRCFTRDAAERAALDHALEQRNSVILQAPVGAALLTGPELRFELANVAYCRMLGRADLVGKSFAEAFPELVGSKEERALRRVLETGRPLSTDETRIELDVAPGVTEERYFKGALQPLRTPGGEIQGIVAIAVDVTEQVCARRELERSAAEREQLLVSLREASRVKDEFLAMLGHELRNPLSPIVTALQLMRMRGDTSTGREQAMIQRQVEHLVRLVDDLLDVSRITRGSIELKRERCELSAILTKAVEQASTLLEQRRHRLQVEAEPGLHCECDPVRLAQVVANLLTNAARYTDPGGVIRLRASREEDGRLAIRVRDNGRGMAAETLSKVFECFYQGGRGMDRAEGGLGVGLAIVRSLVELHGGSVEAHSAGLGRGSEFVVRLPGLAQSGETSPVPPPPVERSVAPAGRRILLVDDNADAVETLGELLRMCGHAVSVFTDPVSALRALPELKPQLAVLDIGLPVMDGYELAARIRAVCGDSCVLVALTGYGQDSDRKRAREAGFQSHLVKPVAHDRLLDILQTLA